MPYSQSIKNKASNLRTEGYSFSEISTLLKLPRGTIYSWTHSLNLDQKARTRIQQRRLHGIEQTKKWFVNKKTIDDANFNQTAKQILEQVTLSKPILQIFSSILFWAEGSKLLSNVSFMNSDPAMIRLFLQLLRQSFPLDETKFRILLHLHEYHDETKMINFWSKITSVPTTQFTKTYRKPHTKKRIHEGYQGCCKVKYYDTRVARTLTAIYNTFAENIGP